MTLRCAFERVGVVFLVRVTGPDSCHIRTCYVSFDVRQASTLSRKRLSRNAIFFQGRNTA